MGCDARVAALRTRRTAKARGGAGGGAADAGTTSASPPAHVCTLPRPLWRHGSARRWARPPPIWAPWQRPPGAGSAARSRALGWDRAPNASLLWSGPLTPRCGRGLSPASPKAIAECWRCCAPGWRGPPLSESPPTAACRSRTRGDACAACATQGSWRAHRRRSCGATRRGGRGCGGWR